MPTRRCSIKKSSGVLEPTIGSVTEISRTRSRLKIARRQHSFAGVNQQNRSLRRRGSSRHIEGVLFVSWRIGNNEAAGCRGKKSVRGIDGDALLALGLQAVD